MSDEISLFLIAALCFKLNFCVHIRRAISCSHVTHADRSWLVPIEFKSGPSYVKHTISDHSFSLFGKPLSVFNQITTR